MGRTIAAERVASVGSPASPGPGVAASAKGSASNGQLADGQMAMSETRLLIDTYLDWIAGEGIPVVEDFGLDLLSVGTAPWPRMGGGARGAYVHVKGRGDFVNAYVCELPPGGQTDPQRHLFEEVVYVLDGRGS